MADSSFFKNSGTTTFPSQAAASQTRLYLGSYATAPAVDLAGDSLISGMLYADTFDGNLYVHDGTSWSVTSAGLKNIVEDTTPQLGGDLQSNGSDIVMVADDILQLGTDANMSTLLLHASAQNTTRFQSANVSFMKRDGSGLTAEIKPTATKPVVFYAGGSEKLAVQGSGILVTGNTNSTTATIASLDYPTADGTAGQVVTTDGSGTLTFADAGGASVGSAIAFAIAL